jgi:phospholipid/cholesterol/gamma-HCH transport system substrate-binding protein
MITRRTLANLVAFLAVTAALVAYGVVDLLGNPFNAPTTVSAVFPDASGIAPGLGVALDGVNVGSVTSVHLEPGGARVEMALQPGSSVPDDVEATIGLANDLGQQEVDLVVTGSRVSGPLKDGAVVPAVPNALPTDIGRVVQTASQLLSALPVKDLNTVLQQLDVAFSGQASDVDQIVNASRQFSAELLDFEQQFESLLSNAPPVLDTLASVGPQLDADLEQTAVLGAVLSAHRYDLVHLLYEGVSVTSVADQLVSAEDPNLACLLHDGAGVLSNLGSSQQLAALEQALSTEQWFFGAVDAISPTGPSTSLFPGDPASTDQEWLRTRLLLPPRSPSADQYSSPTALPSVLPGAACDSSLGRGVGPAAQATAPLPVAGARFSPAASAEARVEPPAG